MHRRSNNTHHECKRIIHMFRLSWSRGFEATRRNGDVRLQGTAECPWHDVEMGLVCTGGDTYDEMWWIQWNRDAIKILQGLRHASTYATLKLVHTCHSTVALQSRCPFSCCWYYCTVQGRACQSGPEGSSHPPVPSDSSIHLRSRPTETQHVRHGPSRS